MQVLLMAAYGDGSRKPHSRIGRMPDSHLVERGALVGVHTPVVPVAKRGNTLADSPVATRMPQPGRRCVLRSGGFHCWCYPE